MTAGGDLVLLEQQDRTSWDGEAIGEGCALVEAALRQRRAGPFQVQAAIAACHAQAAEAGDTDWAQIAALYERLSAMVPSPVVELNRAVAVGMAEGPDAGLAQLDQLAAMHGESLKDYYLFPAVRADLLRRLGRDADAAVAYREALALVTTEAERRYLARRHGEVAASLPLGASNGRHFTNCRIVTSRRMAPAGPDTNHTREGSLNVRAGVRHRCRDDQVREAGLEGLGLSRHGARGGKQGAGRRRN